MVKLSKSQFGRAIEGKSVVTTEGAVPPSRHKSKWATGVIITALIAIFGIGAGWLGGKVLTRRLSPVPAVAPPSDASTGEKPAGEKPATASQPSKSQPSESPRPANRDSSAGSSPSSRSEANPEAEKPLPKPEPALKEAATKEAPPKVPRVDKEEETDKVSPEDPAKEIGRKALKKMSKDIQKSKRDPANKNDNDRDN